MSDRALRSPFERDERLPVARSTPPDAEVVLDDPRSWEERAAAPPPATTNGEPPTRTQAKRDGTFAKEAPFDSRPDYKRAWE